MTKLILLKFFVYISFHKIFCETQLTKIKKEANGITKYSHKKKTNIFPM